MKKSKETINLHYDKETRLIVTKTKNGYTGLYLNIRAPEITNILKWLFYEFPNEAQSAFVGKIEPKMDELEQAQEVKMKDGICECGSDEFAKKEKSIPIPNATLIKNSEYFDLLEAKRKLDSIEDVVLRCFTARGFIWVNQLEAGFFKINKILTSQKADEGNSL